MYYDNQDNHLPPRPNWMQWLVMAALYVGAFVLFVYVTYLLHALNDRELLGFWTEGSSPGQLFLEAGLFAAGGAFVSRVAGKTRRHLTHRGRV